MDNGHFKVSFFYKMVLALMALTGILDRAGIFTGNLQLFTLLSFTTISNICVMLISLFTAIKYTLHQKDFSLALAKTRYIVVVMLLVTGIVYHFVLLPAKMMANPSYQVFTIGNIAAHYITPVGLLGDWLLFDKKGTIKKWEPLVCAAAPALYLTIALIYGYYGPPISGMGTSYVYFFMDVEKIGTMGVVKYIVAILVCILALAYSVYAADYFLAQPSKWKQ